MNKNKNSYFTPKVYLGIFLVAVIIVFAISFFLIHRNDEKSSGTANGGTAMIGKFIYERGSDSVKNFDSDIKSALETWDNILVTDRNLPISFYSYSSNDSTLAFAFINEPDDIYSGGVVYINTYNKAQTTMKEILIHEIGHVLGIGTSSKWEENNNDGILDKNAFPKAYGYYKEWADTNKKTLNEKGIPLESSGNHWSEEVFDTEIMTPFSEASGIKLPLSKMTLGALEDIGWEIDYSFSDNF